MRLAPVPPPEVARPLEHVLTRAGATVGTQPEVVLVEDGRQDWLLEASALAPSERAHALIAASTEEALLAAVRLGISGALWLPPSTVTASAALSRVAEATPVRRPDPALAEIVARAADLLVVAVRNAAFWRCQLGEGLLSTCLADLAAALVCPPALVPGPALAVAGGDQDRIRREWAAIMGRRGLATEGVCMVPIPAPIGHCGVTMAAMEALVATPASRREEMPEILLPQPVHELPSGRRVGWWRPHEGPVTSGPEWNAWPTSPNEVGFDWRWRPPDGSEATVVDTVQVGEVAAPAARLPGWVSVTAMAGSPAGLLVERMAVAAQRAGCALWLPEVGATALRFVLSLPGTIWIDGPAVPATSERVDSPSHSP